MKVLKFGGSSVRDAARIDHVATLVAAAAAAEPVAVVVSALGGATDALLGAARAVLEDGGAAEGALGQLEERHLETARDLLSDEELAAVEVEIGAAFADLRERLRGMAVLGEASPRSLDHFAAYGERLAAALLAAALRQRGVEAEARDARQLVVTDDRHGGAAVDQAATAEAIRRELGGTGGVPVVTGFIGATPSGHTTTLGRGGSDLTAALLGAALGAHTIEIWTDVDGVLSADPRRVPEAFSIPELSFEEIMELSHFGAKVLFAPTVEPARAAGIPIHIRNTFEPRGAGTRIVERRRPAPPSSTPGGPITGISSVESVALLRLEGSGLVGVPGVAQRLFGALARARVNVILISQASSEHSICFAIDPAGVAAAGRAVREEFSAELEGGRIQPLVIEGDLSVVAVVGEGMCSTPGIAARLFQALGDSDINVKAIAQGSSELNVSVVVSRAHEGRALRALHRAFFAEREPEAEVVVVGPGVVGSEVLRQIVARPASASPRLRVVGVANSKGLWLDVSPRGEWPQDAPRSAEDWADFLGRQELEPLDDLRHLEPTGWPRVLVDTTAGAMTAPLYTPLLEAGWSVVSANKVPFAESAELYDEIHRSLDALGRGLRYETTVGAGLPVLATLRALVRAGDRVTRVEGVFSGTLAFLAQRLNAGESLEEAVREAHRRGYTEPDPRADLSGLDVARKLLIIARTCGRALELPDLEVEPLLAAPAGDLEALWDALRSHGPTLAERVRTAAENGLRLAYLAALDDEGARVGLAEVDARHPAARLEGTDNVFLIHTEHYDSPIVITGPGAGPQVTAAGVLADLCAVVDERTASHRRLVRRRS